MARLQGIATLILFTALMTGIAAAPTFKVTIGDVAEANNVTFDHSTDADPLHVLNSTIENTGSIGCEYRLRAEFERENTTEEIWSEGHEMWPGDAENLEIEYLPYNYTGSVDAEVNLRYCGQEKKLKEYSFNSTRKVSTNQTVESETLESGDSSARVKTNLEDGKLVPHEAPAGWKPSTADIDEGEAQVSYSPYLFQPEQELTYLVMGSDGDVRGTTTVELDVEPGIVSRLKERALEIFLLASIALNLVLLGRRRLTGLETLKPLK